MINMAPIEQFDQGDWQPHPWPWNYLLSICWRYYHFNSPEPNHLVTIRILLYCFELISSLVSNHNKRSLVMLSDLAILCWLLRGPQLKIDYSPIKYIGIILRPSFLHHDNYHPLLDKIQSKLATWKWNSLSFAERLTLVYSALSTFPTYWMSFYQILEWVMTKMDGIEKNILWGGCPATPTARHLVN